MKQRKYRIAVFRRPVEENVIMGGSDDRILFVGYLASGGNSPTVSLDEEKKSGHNYYSSYEAASAVSIDYNMDPRFKYLFFFSPSLER